MSGNITLTAALRSNLLSLQGTQTLLDQTQGRLASGLKVNSALDNPISYFAAQNLNTRADNLNNLLDAMGQAVQKLQTANAGLTSLTTMVQQAQAVAQSAQNQQQNSGFVRSGDFLAASAANLTTGAVFATGNAIGVCIAGVLVGTVTGTTNETLQQVADSFNALTGISATIVGGSSTAPSTNVRLEIRATGGQTLTLVGAQVATLMQANNGGAQGSTGMRGDTGGAVTTAVAVASTINVADSVAFENQYRTIRTQIDALVTDTGYAGTNLLFGDTLTVQFNETNSTKLVVNGVTFNSAGLGTTFTAQTPASLTTGTFFNATNIQAALNEITASLAKIQVQAQAFGTTLNIVQDRQEFTKNLVNTLQTGAQALTVADKNEEGANLLALQTAQQLGITSLSLASQANQSVLRLFQ